MEKHKKSTLTSMQGKGGRGLVVVQGEAYCIGKGTMEKKKKKRRKKNEKKKKTTQRTGRCVGRRSILIPGDH